MTDSAGNLLRAVQEHAIPEAERLEAEADTLARKARELRYRAFALRLLADEAEGVR